eukprot:2654311-Amphidinium_carterae.1
MTRPSLHRCCGMQDWQRIKEDLLGSVGRAKLLAITGLTTRYVHTPSIYLESRSNLENAVAELPELTDFLKSKVESCRLLLISVGCVAFSFQRVIVCQCK